MTGAKPVQVQRLTAERLKELVERPVEFLTEILEQLDAASQGAIALIFLHGESGVPSPIGQSPALDMVTRLLGVQPAEVAKAISHLNDSLTRRQSAADGDRWIFRHPTVTDAFAEIVAQSPELIELYVHGAKVSKLIREVVCAPQTAEHAYVRVPTSLFPALLGRFEDCELDEAFKSFLGARASRTFLPQIVSARPDILAWVEGITNANLSMGSILLLAALKSYGLLPEKVRSALVKNIADDAITWMKTEVFADKIYHQILTKNELDDLAERFRAEYLKDLENLLRDLQGRFSSDNELSLYEDFKENMERAESFFFPEGATAGLAMFYDKIDKHIQALGEEDEPSSSDWSEQAAMSANLSATSATENSSTIFDDIDD